jgi:hypothetical protein
MYLNFLLLLLFSGGSIADAVQQKRATTFDASYALSAA